jgi:hypothetical protein
LVFNAEHYCNANGGASTKTFFKVAANTSLPLREGKTLVDDLRQRKLIIGSLGLEGMLSRPYCDGLLKVVRRPTCSGTLLRIIRAIKNHGNTFLNGTAPKTKPKKPNTVKSNPSNLFQIPL